MATQYTQASGSSICTFDLPGEIHNQIYEVYFEHVKLEPHSEVFSPEYYRASAVRPYLSIFEVSRQIYAETRKMFFDDYFTSRPYTLHGLRQVDMFLRLPRTWICGPHSISQVSHDAQGGIETVRRLVLIRVPKFRDCRSRFLRSTCSTADERIQITPTDGFGMEFSVQSGATSTFSVRPCDLSAFDWSRSEISHLLAHPADDPRSQELRLSKTLIAFMLHEARLRARYLRSEARKHGHIVFEGAAREVEKLYTARS